MADCFLSSKLKQMKLGDINHTESIVGAYNETVIKAFGYGAHSKWVIFVIVNGHIQSYRVLTRSFGHKPCPILALLLSPLSRLQTTPRETKERV